MTIQTPQPDFGQIKCPDCDTIMKPITLPRANDERPEVLECPKCRRRHEVQAK